MSAVNPAFSQNLDARPKRVVLLPPQIFVFELSAGGVQTRIPYLLQNDRGLPIDRVMVALFDARGRLSIQ